MSVARILALIFALVAVPLAAQMPDDFAGRLLAAHNDERVAHGIAPLKWNEDLAQQAQLWADTLAASGRFEHAQDRKGAGENLWMGTADYYAPEAMIGAFVNEGRNFRPGQFPNVSATGKWSDVAHYTQLIWPATREVGCAIGSGHGREVLVCRYLPAGNFIGQQVP